MTPQELDRRPFPRWVVRALECVPALLAWSLLLLPILLSSTAPVAVAYFIILFDLWWLFRSVQFAVSLGWSYRAFKRDSTRNWRAELEAGDVPWRDVLHVVVYPFYNEDEEILRHSVQAMADTDYPRDRVVLVIAAEERGGPEAREKAERLQRDFSDRFAAVVVAMHPDGIEGEVKGKAPNINYAMAKFEAEVLPRFDVDPARVIVHSIDSDSAVNPQHFAQTTSAVLAQEQPSHHIYQFIPLYHNNLWDVPAMMRIIATGTTFWLMIETTRPHRLRCFAVYAMTLAALREAGYWDRASIIEDGVQYWRNLLARAGEFSVVPVNSPVYMDAVLGGSYWRTFVAQYKQLRRWAWGATDLSMMVPAFARSPEIPLWQRTVEIVRLIDNHLSWATAPLLLIFVGWMPMLNRSFQQTTLGYHLPSIASALLTAALIGVVAAIVVAGLLAPRPRTRQTLLGRIGTLAQWLLLPFITIFMSLPALHSQTALALGQRMEFLVTVKKRKPVVGAAVA